MYFQIDQINLKQKRKRKGKTWLESCM